MLSTVLAVLAFQQGTITIGPSGLQMKIVAEESDTSRRRDSTQAKKKKQPIAASPGDVASAFADVGARTLLARAREARATQDSSITSYDASTLQRLTVGMAFTKLGRERILFRSEAAARIRWARGVGAQVDVTGERSAAPLFGGNSQVDISTALSPVPYYPGRDAFWLGWGTVKEVDNQDDVVNPLANAAEAYYRYATGDSVSFRLPDGTTIQIRELVVQPRRPDWHAVVASLWFDARTGQLVRAAFRMSQPFDLLNDDDEKAPFIVRTMLTPTEAAINGVAIEYGLHQGRFWLPRTQVIEGSFRAGFMRMPLRVEERFTYASVNALDTMPMMRGRRSLPAPPAAGGDSATSARAAAKFRDSVQTARTKEECAATGQRSVRTDRYNRTLPMIVFVPCDSAKLAHSPTLPGSIFDPGEAVFGDAERDELLKKAESMMPSLTMIAPRPKVDFGLNLVRYNRVEGLSAAIDVTQMIAPGRSVRFSPRIGTADRVFNAELSVEEANGQGTRALTAYRRLAPVGDWGHPLSFGSGLSAFLFGRDEGFYYRATGAELAGDNVGGRQLEWRIFHERQSDAIARTNISLPHALGSDGFGPPWNIMASRIRETGASMRKVSSFGLDPNAFRLLSDLRLEGAGGDRNYGRGALDLTVSHPIGWVAGRFFGAAVTAGAGTSVGELPVQRLWYLGGTNSVRGQPAGAMFGDSYWLTRTEVGYGPAGFRRVAFFDLGWAGDRTGWKRMGRPASGVGLGWSFMDGLIRADVGRGIFPTKQWHSALYLDARF